MKDAAEMYAVGCISKEDVEYLIRKELGISKSFDELPQEFHDYVKEYAKGFDEYIERKANAECPGDNL
jgi:hypothetical protein